MTKADLSLGFVGLGALGLPMAINLDKAGFPLRVHTRSRKAETNPELEGATPCSSPAEASTGVDVLLLCVSDDAAVEEVLFGVEGAASQLRAGSVVLDCSTIAPATAQHCAERLARQNVHYMDAPVTGGTEGAKRGSLTVLVGGASEPLERVRPILEVIGGSIHHFGDVGRGQQVKAVNQVLVAGSYAAVAEAMALGTRMGLPMPAVIEALRSGAAGSWALDHRAAQMLDQHFPLGFRLSLHRKDLAIALEAADEVQLEKPLALEVASMEDDLIGRGYGDQDVSALARWFMPRE